MTKTTLTDPSKLQHIRDIKSILKTYKKQEPIGFIPTKFNIRKEILLLVQLYISITKEKLLRNNIYTRYILNYETFILMLVYIKKQLICLMQLNNIVNYDYLLYLITNNNVESVLENKIKKEPIKDYQTLFIVGEELLKTTSKTQKLFYTCLNPQKNFANAEFNPYLKKITKLYKEIKKFLLE